MSRPRRLVIVTAMVVGALVLSVAPGPVGDVSAAAAVSGSQFTPGYIISDSAFYTPGTMTAEQIQAFLVQRGANCVAGERPCLKDFRMATPSMTAEAGLCGAYTGSGNESSAQIIAKVAQACGINPQVLLVLLQKETSLVTKTAPTASNYDRAAGFGCPDNGPNGTANCNAQYYGFFNQLYRAARQYLRYRANPTGYGYQAGRVNSILYHPNTACGSAKVYIENQATAGLYIYTPYVPNAAALANMYGTGDGCSSYGNRNFFRIFYDWFGDPRGDTTAATAVVKALYEDLLGRGVDSSGLGTWTSNLMNGRSQAELVGLLTSSQEYVQLRVTQAYRGVLRREPDPDYVKWVNVVMSGRTPVDDVAFTFYLSDEFYLQGGGTNEGFVRRMYDVMLGRPPSNADVAAWTAQIPVVGRSMVVRGIWFSMEAAQRRAGAYYQTFLRRAPDRPGQEAWARVLLAQGEGAVRIGIAGSAEYRGLAISRFPPS